MIKSDVERLAKVMKERTPYDLFLFLDVKIFFKENKNMVEINRYLQIICDFKPKKMNLTICNREILCEKLSRYIKGARKFRSILDKCDSLQDFSLKVLPVTINEDPFMFNSSSFSYLNLYRKLKKFFHNIKEKKTFNKTNKRIEIERTVYHLVTEAKSKIVDK